MIFCLMPTYGRKPELLNASLACFQEQTYQEKHLIIYDDLGNLKDTKIHCPNVTLLSSPTRCPSMGGKYNTMIQYSKYIPRESPPAYCVWDDDDIYMPHHLEYHAAILEHSSWSKPTTILSTYTGSPQKESSAGRFHGSIAVKNPVWPQTRRATFDMEFIALLESKSPAGDPCKLGEPQYVYRWGSTQSFHSSGRIHEEAYFTYPPQYADPIPELYPEFDTDEFKTVLLLQNKKE
jgi:glycosyltransferase involved in cell wall biosynthesis